MIRKHHWSHISAAIVTIAVYAYFWDEIGSAMQDAMRPPEPINMSISEKPVGPAGPPTPPLQDPYVLGLTIFSAFAVMVAGKMNLIEPIKMFAATRRDRYTAKPQLSSYLGPLARPAIEQSNLRLATLISGFLGIMLWKSGIQAFEGFAIYAIFVSFMFLVATVANTMVNGVKSLRLAWPIFQYTLLALASNEVAARVYELVA